MEIYRKLGGMTPVCDGTGSHFALERSLVIFVLWPSTLATLFTHKFGQNSCILVVSHPFEALRRSAFSNLAATGIWSCDTPLWWRVVIKPFAWYLIIGSLVCNAL